jgi:Glu-tRNA(Gln) amidotransferase subunit E-like FAD-binding protein
MCDLVSFGISGGNLDKRRIFMSSYFVEYQLGKQRKGKIVKEATLSIEDAKSVIGSPMVEQLTRLAEQSVNEPILAARLLHNTLTSIAKDPAFQAAAQVVWNNLIHV